MSFNASPTNSVTPTWDVPDRSVFRPQLTTHIWSRLEQGTIWSRRNTTRAKAVTNQRALKIGPQALWLARSPCTRSQRRSCISPRTWFKFLFYFKLQFGDVLIRFVIQSSEKYAYFKLFNMKRNRCAKIVTSVFLYSFWLSLFAWCLYVCIFQLPLNF